MTATSRNLGPVLLALDSGSRSGRCLAFDADGALIAGAQHPWAPETVPGLEPFGMEFNPRFVWTTLAGLVRQVLTQVDPARVAGVSVTALRLGNAFVDVDGNSVYLGPNCDIRALVSDLTIETLIDEKLIYEITRHWPPMVCAPSRLCWYKAHAPEIHARIRYALSFSDWMVHQLCGVACSECSSASDLMMLDVGKRRWSTRMAAALGWDVAQLQPLLPPGEKAGEVHERAAAETGLRVGAPVIVGGGDTQSALLGMGVLDDGQIGIVAGSSAPVALINDQPVYDPDDNLWIGCHVLPDRWLLEANSGEMGSLHQWMIDSFAADLRIHAQQSAQSVYHLYDETAREAPIGCRGVTAHLGPRRHNLRSVNTGRPAGLLLPFGNAINQNPSRENLLRAFYENCAFALRANVELVETAAGRRASSVTLGGGMSRSALLCEILAATLDRPVQAAAVYEASALGAAICAAAGAGLTGSLIEGAAKMIRPGTVYEPDADAVDEYAEFYERWVEREAQLEEM